MKFKNISDEILEVNLANLFQLEKKTTAEIVEHVAEVEFRGLFLSRGYKTMFDYLTVKHEQSNGNTQRWLDAARLRNEMPEITEQLKKGTVSLTKLYALARNVREKQKASKTTISIDEKKEILEAIQGQTLESAEQTICQMLNIEVKEHEKQRTQQDESVRLEVTFSKEDMELLREVKSSLSHVHPNASTVEIFRLLAKEHLKKKNRIASKPKSTSNVEVKSNSNTKTNPNPRFVPAPTKRLLHQNQKGCQWVNNQTGTKCGSNFQIQIDHIQPIWAGGMSNIENLQLLCSIHNKQKYKIESGIKSVRPRT